TRYDGQADVPTFAEALAIARAHNVGIYPELKHPTFLKRAGLDPFAPFVAAVQAGGGQGGANKMFLPCLRILALLPEGMMSLVRWNCIQLMSAEGGPWDRQDMTYASMLSDDELRGIAAYARGIGVEKSLILPRDAGERSLPATDLCARAHRAGLKVHAWTF